MLIRFQNLGKIKETTLDLRPLTVIIGPNNSNKTYIAYSLYGLWQAERDVFDTMMMFNSEKIGALVNNSLMTKEDDLLRALQKTCDTISDTFTERLTNFYQDSSDKLFSHTNIRVEIAPVDVSEAARKLSGTTTKSDTTFPFYGEYAVIYEHKVITAIPENDAGSQRKLDSSAVSVALGSAFQQKLFSRPFLLPAERNAFIITYKMLANRRYKALRESVRQAFGSRASTQRQLDLLREGGEIRYPEPVEDFLDFLTSVESAKPPNTRSPFA